MENHANKLIDAFDLISGGVGEDETWNLAHRLVAAVGGNHIVTSRILKSNRSVLWFRTSMHEDWIDEYMGQGYLYCDTILNHRLNNVGAVKIEAGTLSYKHGQRNDEVSFNRGLSDAGYGSLLSHSFYSEGDTSTNFVTICFDRNMCLIDENRVKSVQALLSIFLNRTPNCNSPGLVRYGAHSLTDREREVLQLLAHGNLTNRIADRLMISDAMVHKHFRKARIKLGAATREQALAIAMSAGVISL